MTKPMPLVTNQSETEIGLGLLRVIEMFRDIDPEIQAQSVAVFLTVANHPHPMKMADIGNRLSLAHSSVSRNVAYLGSVNRHHKKGHGLLDAYEDPTERRRKLVKLTAKGQRFFQRVSTTF